MLLKTLSWFKRTLIAFSFGLMLSCATGASDPSDKEFRQIFADENHRMYQTLMTVSGFKFREFNLEDYRFRMQKQNPDLLKQINSFDEVQLGTSPRAFVVCVKSIARNVAVCDNGSTAFVDRIKVDKPLPDLQKLMDEIRGP